MVPAYSRTLRIEPGYVLRWIARAAVAASLPLLLLPTLLHGINPFVALGAGAAAVFLLLLLPRALGWALRQSIHLHPDRIVFDSITASQTYVFGSPGEWRIDEHKGYWRITAAEGQAIKFIPKAAYPYLKYVAQRFYAATTTSAMRAARRVPYRRRLDAGTPCRSVLRSATPWLRLAQSPRRHGHRHLRSH